MPVSFSLEWQERLAVRLSVREVRAWGKMLPYDERLCDALYHIILEHDSRVAEHAAWIFTHAETDFLQSIPFRYREMWIERAMNARSETLRRLLLTLVCRLSLPSPLRTDFLDYCLSGMISSRHSHSVRALCMKLAYKITCSYPELSEELKLNLEIMEPDLLLPSLRSVHRHIMLKCSKKSFVND